MILGSAQGDLPAASAQGWIELLNCNWGMSRRIRSAVGARKSRELNAPNVGEIAIIQYIDSASSTIHQYPFNAIVNGGTPSILTPISVAGRYSGLCGWPIALSARSIPTVGQRNDGANISR